jgi:hypothetical protein
MITANICGGLGNQLFQIYNAIAYALRHNQSFVFPLENDNTKQETREESQRLKKAYTRLPYWDTLFQPIQHFVKSREHIRYQAFNVVREKRFAYDPVPLHTSSVLMVGYFQSYKYFQDKAALIHKLLFLDMQKERVATKYGFPVGKYVAMHFRLGDYKHLQEYHSVLPADYYVKALGHVINGPSTHVLVFCEEADELEVKVTLAKCLEHYPNIVFEIVDHGIPDWEQILIMSLCRHNIIANSTFSWWGAYWNANPGAKVCYPSTWFGPRGPSIEESDLFPEGWTKIVSV